MTSEQENKIINSQICKRCNQTFQLSEEFFYRHNGMANGYLGICKICISVYHKKYNIANKEILKIKNAKRHKENKEAINKANMKRYYANHEENKKKRREWNATPEGKAIKKEGRKRYKEKYSEEIKKREIAWRNSPAGKTAVKKYREEHKDFYRENRRVYDIERRKADKEYKLITNLRTRINQAINSEYKKGRAIEMLGCSIKKLKKYLESQFVEDMSWDNYGRDGWHIDHILPCSSFNLLDREQQNKCFHFSNLQPLWAIDNLKKGASIPDENMGLNK